MTIHNLSELHKAMIPRTSVVPELSLTVPANPAYICLARKAVDAFAEALDFTPDERQQIYLAVSEAVSNAIRSTMRTVTLRASERPDGLQIEIRNTGIWDIPDVETCTTMPEPTAECGRGIPLMYITMDTVEFYLQNGETCVRLFKQRKK
jgi:serine/threonine-protein kinase RsbW